MAKRGGFPGGGMPGNMANLMKQAQRMQRQMEEQQKELGGKRIYSNSGRRCSGSDRIRKARGAESKTCRRSSRSG